jgi:hypothetical protein
MVVRVSLSMPEQIPSDFDARFLDRFRERTAQAWARYQTRDFMAAGVGGRDWQQGTRWQGGLTETQIYQTDVIVYGADLRRYFLIEFAGLLSIDRDPIQDEAAATTVDPGSIPFWSEAWDL